MSAPDSSNSKAPPSLLADTPKASQANGARILANLEGRVEPPTDAPRRSRKPLLLVSLLVVAAGGWGAWQLQQRAHGGHAEVATSATSAASNSALSAAAPVSASGAVQPVAKAAPTDAASTSQAATIIADDSDSKDSRGSAEANASAPGGVNDNRLSRALANGADMGSASTPAVDATAKPDEKAKPAATVAAHARREHEAAAAHAKHETASVHHASAAAVAQAKKEKPEKQRIAKSDAGSKDDPDADLLAALVARTKPADAKGETTRVSASTGNAKLAERVKECGTRGFFEDQLCRWRVCDGHWGKDPACPGSAPTHQP